LAESFVFEKSARKKNQKMNVNCSTCLELLSPSDDLSCPPCGHVFHTLCIQQCIENTKKCPLCRAVIRSSNSGLRRIYLTQGADVSDSQQPDSSVLQSKLDSLTFDKRLLEAEKKKAVEGCEKAKVQAVALREEVRDLEARLSYAKEETQSYKAQTGLMMGEKKKADRARREADDLREKLALFKNIECVVNGSVAEVNQKMHQMGDYSKASKDLTYMIVTLRKELDAKGKETSQYRKEASSRQSKLIEARASLEMVKQNNESLTADKARLADDNRHLEDEVATLKAKVASLQDAISSPSGDPKQSVINRLISESPAPRLLSRDVEDHGQTPPPPDNKKRPRPTLDSPEVGGGLAAILDLKKSKSMHQFNEPFKDSTNNANRFQQLSQQSKKTSLLLKDAPKFRDLGAGNSPSGTTTRTDLGYDGFGGRCRQETDFPVPLRNGFKINGATGNATNKTKKPKGVSRPKTAASSSSSSTAAGTKSIDNFFSSLDS